MLRQHLDATRAGAGRLILLSGEAGIGKSALIDALIRDARATGTRVVVAASQDFATGSPYALWHDLALAWSVAGLQPPLPDPSSAEGDATAARRAPDRGLATAFRGAAEDGPLLIVLEDLHWADEDSLLLLRRVAHWMIALPLLVVVSHRSPDLDHGVPLRSQLPGLARAPHVERLQLRRLELPAVHELIAARYALVPRDAERLAATVQQRADGNPLFITELLRALEDEGVLVHDDGGWRVGDLTRRVIPPLVGEIVQERLDRLEDGARVALEVAAVIGQELSFTLWAAMQGSGENVGTLRHALRQALDARFLVPLDDGESYRFSHAIVREVVYGAMLPPDRRAWHRRAGEVLLAATQPDVERIAYHFERAQDPRAIDWLLRAAVRAQRAWSWRTAADRIDAAIALLERASDGADEVPRGWLHYRVGRLLRFAARERVVHAWERAADLARDGGDAVLEVIARTDLGIARIYAGQLERGLRELREGVAALDALLARGLVPDRAALGWLVDRPLLPAGAAADDAAAQFRDAIDVRRGTLVLMEAFVGQLAEALAHGDALRMRCEAPAPVAIAGASLGVGVGEALAGRPSSARASFARARAIYGQVGNQLMRADAAIWDWLLAVLPYESDDLVERRRLLAEADDALEVAAESLPSENAPGSARLEQWLLEGDWQRARHAAEAAITSGARQSGWRAAVVLAWLALLTGDHARAWEHVYTLLPDGPETPPGTRMLPAALAVQRIAVELALADGAVEFAGRWLDARERWHAWSGAEAWRAETLLLRARLAALAGHADEAATLVDDAQRRAAVPRQPLVLLAAHRFRGELALAAERWASAEADLRAALALADACDAPYERALVLLGLAAHARARGEFDAARQTLAGAVAILEPLGARPALARASELAETLSAPRLERGADGVCQPFPAGLTAREVEILRLVAGGYSNREIAERLQLSVRTVERHVSNVYLKIGTSGKGAATAFAFRHGLL